MMDSNQVFEWSAGAYHKCLSAQLFLWPFWIIVAGSLFLKETLVLKYCENYCKRSHAERSERRKQRLRVIFNDPFLTQLEEERLLRRSDIGGDRRKMQEAMHLIRETANADNIPTAKGEEKLQATQRVMWLTILFSGVYPLLDLLNLWDEALYTYLGSNTPRGGKKLSHYFSGWAYCDECGELGVPLSIFLLVVIHIMHSYKLVRDATRLSEQATEPRKEDVPNETDLEQPLLGDAHVQVCQSLTEA
jgi:hypothetical protein